MGQTVIPFGSPLAQKVFGAAVFAEMVQRNTFMSRMVGPAPSLADAANALQKTQTSANFPIVRINDLTTKAGDTVSVDLFNILQGFPVIGDAKLAGQMMALKGSTQDFRVNQMRGGFDPGGRMTQQRTPHDLRTVGRAALAGWWSRLIDQAKLVHMAGARGSHNTPDWCIPLADHEKFASIMVNAVIPPSYDKRFLAGDATSLDTLGPTDILTLDEIDRISAAIEEMPVPMQPIMLPDDPAASDSPLYLMLVTPRQWHYLQNRTGEKAWRTFLMNARERGSKNPLFAGEPGVWNGILIKKMGRPIRFNCGDVVSVCTSALDGTVTTETVPAAATFGAGAASLYAVDRAIILGAQGLAEVWGKHGGTGAHMKWHEEETDHGNSMEASVSAVGGWGKIQFKDSQGALRDHGIMTLDSYAPDPRSIVVPN